MKKFLLTIGVVIMLSLLIISPTIYAATACTLSSTYYTNADEVENSMLTARLAYQLRGYTVNGKQDPTAGIFLSNVVSRDVQLYFCHGDDKSIAFQSGSRNNIIR